jgi:peptidyl-prolyl cis-trans isomerase SurA
MRIRSIIIILLSLLSFSVYADEQALDAVVAVVNNEVITQSQLDKQVAVAKQQIMAVNAAMPSAAQLRQQALDQLINVRLQLQIAKKANMIVSDEQVDQAIAQIAARNGMTVSQLQQRIGQQNMSYADYRNEIKTEMLVGQIEQSQVAPQVSITDQEVKDALEKINTQPQAMLNQPVDPNVQYHVVDIVVPFSDNPSSAEIKKAQHYATKLLSQLQRNTVSQQQLANDSSIQVNDLGLRPLTQVPDLFIRTVQNLSPGKYSDLLHAPNGFHIIKLVSKSAGQTSNAYQSGAITQSQVNLILIKKNSLFTDAEMQLHLQEIRNQVIESNDFATVAENNSQDPNTANKGGSLGWISSGALPLVVQNAMDQLKVGDTSQPIASGDNYYIVQVTGRRQLTDSNAALQDRARQMVYQQKYAEALQHWIQSLRSQSYVKIT